MSRVFLPGALAPVVAALGLLAAGCGNSGKHPASTAAAGTSPHSTACVFSGAQRRTIAMARADIRRLRRIEARAQTFSERGAPQQETLTGKFLLDLGSSNLPVNVFADLLHRAKAAVRLCGDCSTGLETEEPVLGTRAGHLPACG